MKQTFILMLAGIFLFSCSSTKKTIAPAAASVETNASLTETYWKLTELIGQPETTPEGQKEMHLILKKDGNMINGFGGCNTFRGTYRLQEATFRITFSKMASTLMACLNMEKEKSFIEVLEKADNYAILGNVLSLNKARMAPLAKFEKVLIK